MINILSISSVVPYDGVAHAGGKTYNSYIKSLARDGSFNISILAFSRKKDLRKNDYKSYGINDLTIISSGTLSVNLTHFIIDLLGNFGDYGKLYSEYKKYMVMTRLQSLNARNQMPDIVELEWTDMVLLAKNIKENYPKLKIVASEHDVSFLGAYRRYINGSDKEKFKLKRKYELIKRLELEAIDYCDIVMPHNLKDANLLIDNGVSSDKIFTIVPYYHNMSAINRRQINHDILFWGAMGRDENAEACRWFIKNVLPLLDDLDIRFIIAGNNPPEDLQQLRSNRIVVTGFIENEIPLFENSLCFVCPLLNGAGIKVKVLEAMSAGIPVLTNDIGIEGIPGEDGVSYYRCITPEQYAFVVRKLISSTELCNSIGMNAKKLIDENYNLNNSINKYIRMLKTI